MWPFNEIGNLEDALDEANRVIAELQEKLRICNKERQTWVNMLPVEAEPTYLSSPGKSM